MTVVGPIERVDEGIIIQWNDGTFYYYSFELLRELLCEATFIPEPDEDVFMDLNTLVKSVRSASEA